MIIERTLRVPLLALAKKFPIVTVTGPRQSGKTTLCRSAFPEKPYVSLEPPDVREWADRDPRGFLQDHSGGAILDEVQRVPALLSYLQDEVDRRPARGRFILTGSANFALLESVSQSLAGRAALLTLLPLDFEELKRFPKPPADLDSCLLKGAYPAIHDRRIEPADWYAAYSGTYVERDVRQILHVGDLAAFQMFLRLCAGRTGQLLNQSSLAADAGITHNTARAWVSVLEASYLVFRLHPLLASVRKRLVKMPKLHFFDSGLLCWLLGIRSAGQLREHPLRGLIFESWVVSEIYKMRVHRGLPPSLCYYREAGGLEVDAIIEEAGSLIAIETKSGRTVASDWFRGLDSLARALDAAAASRRPALKRVVVTGGAEARIEKGGAVIPWSAMDRQDWGTARRSRRSSRLRTIPRRAR